jgi:hypothetical protein
VPPARRSISARRPAVGFPAAGAVSELPVTNPETGLTGEAADRRPGLMGAEAGGRGARDVRVAVSCARATRGALTPQMGRSCLTGGVNSWRKRQIFIGVLGGTRLERPHVVNCAGEYPTSRRVS